MEDLDLMKPDTPIIWRVNQQGKTITQREGIVIGTGSSPDSIKIKIPHEDSMIERWVSRNNLHIDYARMKK